MAEYYTVVTDIGLELLNDCLITQKIFPGNKMAVGDSNGVYYEPEKTQTALKNQKYITNVAQKGKKGNYIFFNMQIPPSEGDYTIREVGLFDKENNLLAVAKYPETLKQKTSGSSNKTIMIEIQIELSDNAINTIIIDNSGNLVTEDKLKEYQKLNEKGIKNGYTPLNEQAQIPYNHIPAPYKVFCINSGILGADGLPAFLKLEENTLKTVGSFDLTTAQGVTYTINDELTKDVSGLDEGEYNIFINPETKEISLKNNKIHIDNKFPSDAKIGDYLLNIAKPPFDLEEKTASENLIGLKEVYAGSLSVSGDSTLMLFNYNKDFLKADKDLSNLSSEGEAHFDNKYVQKTGDVVTGNLIVENSGNYVRFLSKDSNFDIKTDLVSSDEYTLIGGYTVTDKNNEQTASFQNQLRGEAMELLIFTSKYIDEVKKSASLTLSIDNNGDTLFSFPKCNSAPTTKASANSGKVDAVIKNYSSGTTGYIQFSSGLKIQWGAITESKNTSVVVTLPLAFSSTYYNVQLNDTNNGRFSYGAYINSKSSFTGYAPSAPFRFFWHAIGY